MTSSPDFTITTAATIPEARSRKQGEGLANSLLRQARAQFLSNPEEPVLVIRPATALIANQLRGLAHAYKKRDGEQWTVAQRSDGDTLTVYLQFHGCNGDAA